MRFFVARFHITKPANTAWAAANVRASLARLWVRFLSCRRTTHRFRWPLCTVRATCCHRVVFSSNNSRYRAGTFDSCLLVIYFLRKNVENNEKTSFDIIFPEKKSYKKVNENRKICSETIFYRNIFLWGFWKEFGRNLAWFCDFFGRVTILKSGKIIRNFQK